jgi:hypothetical protein
MVVPPSSTLIVGFGTGFAAFNSKKKKFYS